jgi:replicative DNA helicase
MNPLMTFLDSAVAFVNEQLSGEDATKGLITTGIDSFDRLAGGIQSHEYVVVGARTSTGKSSFINQMAGHNLRAGKRVAIFTLGDFIQVSSAANGRPACWC